MKRRFYAIVSGVAFFAATQLYAQSAPAEDWFRHSVSVIEQQLKGAAATFTPGLNPRSVNPNGTVRTAPYTDWTTGFFPGSLWYGYELTGNKDTRSGFGDGILEAARKNENIIALTADLLGSLKLNAFIKEFPNRFI